MLRVTVAVPALVTDVAWWRRWWWSVIGLRLFFALFLWSCAKTRRTNQTNERKKRYVLHWSMGCLWGRYWCPKTYSPKNNSSNNDITEIPNALRTLLFGFVLLLSTLIQLKSIIHPSIAPIHIHIRPQHLMSSGCGGKKRSAQKPYRAN